jgi:hypothetical protein
MRVDPRPRRSREELLHFSVHELIRDYPELLRVFEDLGLSPREHGAAKLADLVGEDVEALDRLYRELDWRA